jgi:2-keto-4-pentenoate hydratase/2-oxohepta-3-ene-1,7-dioic acid hydratase in catechol pathway
MKAISESEALDGIFGLTVLADVFAADDFWVKRNPLLARNFDTFCPVGPCIATVDELKPGSPLVVRVEINGKAVQQSELDWAHPISSLIAEITEVVTLEPGDVISLNTPGNTDAASEVPVQLNAGGSIALEVERIGRIECPITAR